MIKDIRFYTGVIVGAAIFAIILQMVKLYPKNKVYDYAKLPQCMKLLYEYEIYSKPDIKLFGRGRWLQGEELKPIDVFIDKEKVVAVLVDATSNDSKGCKEKLVNYWGSYLNGYIAVNNLGIIAPSIKTSSGYMLYTKESKNELISHIEEISKIKDKTGAGKKIGESLNEQVTSMKDGTQAMIEELGKVRIGRYRTEKYGKLVGDDIRADLNSCLKEESQAEGLPEVKKKSRSTFLMPFTGRN
ncbi:MAG: hypothetical protein O3C54_06340 [Proteobacteria bacterium]|nr:hypothetical protein [Pseudomonadota bacterium]MDA0938956.1 hypothetical protein [Pseudomonadota bacterium]